MTKTVLGIFTERENASTAIEKLKVRGYKPEDISIIMRNASESKEIAEDTGTSVAGGAMTGATTGALIGGLAGLLASFVIPGIGAFFIGGPIASAIGLTGAAATTASGAATGALAGGLFGALSGLGLSEDEAKVYEERINTGGILVAIPAHANDEREVEAILSEYRADQIKSVSASSGTDRFEDRRTMSKTVDSDDIQEESSDFSPTYHAMNVKGGKSKKSSESIGKDVLESE